MAEALLSAFLPSLFQAIIAELLKEQQLSEHHLEERRKHMIAKLDMIQAILGIAEKKTQLSQPEEAFFASLKDASYEGTETLDEYLYEVRRHKVIHFASFRNSHVTSAFNPLRAKFRHDMDNKIKGFAERIDSIRDLQEMHSAFQFQAQHCDGGGGAHEPTTLLPPAVVRGRHGDEEKIVEMLLRPDLRPTNVAAVLPIVGEPYIGKTTVAQLVLNAQRVARHFELKLWVHVSCEFSVERITSSIIESIQGLPLAHCGNLNTLHTSLERLLRGRRYLIVLDDYWNENWQDWDKLKRSFLSGAPGSKIIVTTRSENVARLLGTTGLGPHKLQRLEEDDCLSLFSQCAQGTDDAHVLDTRLKEEVLRKCNGVPFIAASLGYTIRLRQEKDRSKWVDILREENWDSSTSHFNRALRLSYVQLDYHLKPCFAYSSIIPQKFQFEKEWLIKHWMAQGFIPDTRDQTIEETGRTYFRSLVSQSFFQIIHVDRTGEEEHRYILSETMQGLASHVSGPDCGCYVMGTGQSHNIPERVRHLTVVFSKDVSEDMFQVISCGKFLHTLIALGGSEDLNLEIPDDIDKRYKRLRALDLSNFGVTVLPKSIGKLMHLRCLQLQGTKIKCLPESICDLYSLQTLGLRNCYDLEELPHDLKRLRELRHIDLLMTRDPRHNVCSLRFMPKDIGLLTNLQTLSRFVISERSIVHTYRGGIGELAELNGLRGELLISNVHLVKDAQEAEQARLASKQFLQKLELSWSKSNEEAEQSAGTSSSIGLDSRKILQKLKLSSSSNSDNEEADVKILDRLSAPTSIKELTISGYTGTACPGWLGSPGYTNLVTVSLCDFKRCRALPCLGLLSHLENLHLRGWDSLVTISCSEFCGDCFGEGGVRASFRSLKKLHLERMDRLQRWDGDENCALPSLRELVLENCCKLEQVTHSLPSLAKITVEGSTRFHGLRRFPYLKHVKVNASGDWIWGSWGILSSPVSITLCKLPTARFPSLSEIRQSHTSLKRLEISHCEQLQHIPEDWPPRNLTHFSVRHCPLLRELPRGIQRLHALEDMEIVSCGKLTKLPDMGGLRSLIRLEISDCGSIVSLPNGGLPSSVQVVSINNCPLLARSCKTKGSADHAKIKKILVWIDGNQVAPSADL